MPENETNETKVKPKFSPIRDLTESQRKDFEFVKTRIGELQESRQSHYGVNLDTLWADADKDYIPHRLKTKGRRAIATDEDKGWRGTLITLGTSDWQSDISQVNAYVKIQMALSILIDQNPSGVFTSTAKKYEMTTELMRQLYQRSWEYAKSKAQLKLFVFNLAKYGWAVARTFPLRIARKVRVLTKYNQEKPDDSVYEEKEVIEYNDIMRENLDPRNVWIDDMVKPNDCFSMRDWCWRKVYAWEVAETEFSKYKNWKYAEKGGTTTEVISPTKTAGKEYKEKDLVEIVFYENRVRDLFMVLANGTPVIVEPLPISDARGIKKLSCWQTYWTLRHAESPFGIGIYEAIRYDQALVDRIRNMTIDQLTLSIYKMFFYQGTQALTDTGDIKIAPGIGKQTLDPKNINWLEVPGPGRDSWLGLELFKKDLDEASGITDPLMGVVTGKTAFELAQAKESALKRMKTPLDNILEALNYEGYITVSLIQLLYSLPETYTITDQQLIEDYLHEIQSDPQLYERQEKIDEDGNLQETFQAKVYPEFPLNLDTDEKGNLIETQKTQFFRIKPQYLRWEGIINIKSQSLLTPSKQIDKALELEMYNILIPLLVQPPEIYQKVAKNVVKLYDKDPRDILPDLWLQEPLPQPEEPLFISAGQEQGVQPAQGAQAPTLPPPGGRIAPEAQIPQQPQGIVGRMISKLAAPFRRV